MVKRAAIISLALLYTVTVIGFALNLHYCGDRIISVKFNAPAKNCYLAATGKMKCCHNTHLKIKVKDAHQGEVLLSSLRAWAFQIPKFPVSGFFLSSQWVIADKPADRAPPDPSICLSCIFLKNSQFRI